MKFYIFVLFLVSCDSSSLGRVCSKKECYWGPEGTKNVGVCRGGKPVCNEKMEVVECYGQVLPSPEICDGLDNFCTGKIDNIPSVYFSSRLGYGLEEYPCLHLGECLNGHVQCNNGSWTCQYGATVELPQEVSCDIKDNDCDGAVDDNLFQGQYCYEGPIGTELHYPCHPGALKCISGNVICSNQGLPAIETCNNFDDDCDGIRDNTASIRNTEYDLVFIVDTSGSMAEEINAVATALNAYSEQFDNNENYKFALVIMSEEDVPYVRVDTNFTDFQTIRNRISILQARGGGSEASLDSMFLVCDPVNFLGLNWRQASIKMMFVFTDEYPQTYLTPRVTTTMISDVCLTAGMFIYIWAQTTFEFLDLTQTPNAGEYFDLTEDWGIMFEQMNSIIVSHCAAAEN